MDYTNVSFLFFIYPQNREKVDMYLNFLKVISHNALHTFHHNIFDFVIFLLSRGTGTETPFAPHTHTHTHTHPHMSLLEYTARRLIVFRVCIYRTKTYYDPSKVRVRCCWYCCC